MNKIQPKLNMPNNMKPTIQTPTQEVVEESVEVLEEISVMTEELVVKDVYKAEEPVNKQHAEVLSRLTQNDLVPANQHPSENTPSNWYLTPHNDSDLVDAVNTVSGRRITCTVKEFNIILKG
jgi:hypothetical protein